MNDAARRRRVLYLLKQRKFAAEQYHRAKTPQTRQTSFLRLLEVKDELNQYRPQQPPAAVVGS